jgi:hypothetical protein
LLINLYKVYQFPYISAITSSTSFGWPVLIRYGIPYPILQLSSSQYAFATMHPTDPEVHESGLVHRGASVAEALASRPSIPWFRDRNLRKLYSVLIPAALFVAATNGYDGSMVNGLQSLNTWKQTFDNPTGAILGLLSASYPLGAILSTPVSAWISDRFGRRWSIFIGSFIMLIGVAMQTASQTGQYRFPNRCLRSF